MKLITPRGYACGYAPQPPKIDGRLDDPAWQAAPWTEEFLDIQGPTKPRPRFRTRAKMLWDKENFYIAAELEEPHVMGTVTRHDAVIFADNDFEVFINPDGDNHNYYELELNALNTTWDLFLNKPYKDGGKADNSFELTGMKTAVRVKGTINDPRDRDEGWCVEIAIPWKALAQHAHVACPPRPGDQWRIDFSRVEWKFNVVNGKYVKVPKLPEDNWIWSPPGIVDMHRPERWGYVRFSAEPPGEATFVPDPTLPARDRLMEVYHREKSFREEHGRFATSLQELGIEQAVAKEFPKPIELKATKPGFEATLDVSLPGGEQHLYVNQDSHLTSTPVNEGPLQTALDRAGSNRGEIQKALDGTSGAEREAMEFLVANMSRRDLRTLSAAFLLENVRLACQTWDEAPWKRDVPHEIFLNYVLPYANIDERRDPWRKEFHDRFAPLVKQARTPGEAAVLLNQKVFPLVKVQYSTKRRKAVQSPKESMDTGLASCTGLTILLVDACRAVRRAGAVRRHDLDRWQRQPFLDRSLGRRRMALHRFRGTGGRQAGQGLVRRQGRYRRPRRPVARDLCRQLPSHANEVPNGVGSGQRGIRRQRDRPLQEHRAENPARYDTREVPRARRPGRGPLRGLADDLRRGRKDGLQGNDQGRAIRRQRPPHRLLASGQGISGRDRPRRAEGQKGIPGGSERRAVYVVYEGLAVGWAKVAG